MLTHQKQQSSSSAQFWFQTGQAEKWTVVLIAFGYDIRSLCQQNRNQTSNQNDKPES